MRAGWNYLDGGANGETAPVRGAQKAAGRAWPAAATWGPSGDFSRRSPHPSAAQFLSKSITQIRMTATNTANTTVCTVLSREGGLSRGLAFGLTEAACSSGSARTNGRSREAKYVV